jgi:hypothetical protein
VISERARFCADRFVLDCALGGFRFFSYFTPDFRALIPAIGAHPSPVLELSD